MTTIKIQEAFYKGYGSRAAKFVSVILIPTQDKQTIVDISYLNESEEKCRACCDTNSRRSLERAAEMIGESAFRHRDDKSHLDLRSKVA